MSSPSIGHALSAVSLQSFTGFEGLLKVPSIGNYSGIRELLELVPEPLVTSVAFILSLVPSSVIKGASEALQAFLLTSTALDPTGIVMVSKLLSIASTQWAL